MGDLILAGGAAKIRAHADQPADGGSAFILHDLEGCLVAHRGIERQAA